MKAGSHTILTILMALAIGAISHAGAYSHTAPGEMAVLAPGGMVETLRLDSTVGGYMHTGGMAFGTEFEDPERNSKSTTNMTANRHGGLPVGNVTDVSESVISQGAERIGSDKLNELGYTGKGIKVAVIDLGFDIDNAEIAGNIKEFRSFLSGSDIRGTDGRHGAASAEIILDVAPNVELYLYNMITDVEFFTLVDHIIERKDIDIVSVSATFPGRGPGDGTGMIAKKVTEARDSGILWVNSAGNYASRHWQGQFTDLDSDGRHDFAGSNAMSIHLAADQPIDLALGWDDWESPSQDFALCIREIGREKRCATEDQSMGDPPHEEIGHFTSQDTEVQITIERRNADRNVNFHLFSLNQDLHEYAIPETSLATPADAVGALSVGAVGWRSGALKDYSSQGPTVDGRTKPDLTAPTDVRTTSYDYPYGGTSAAAPHVAGAAALVMEMYPAATADQVQNVLESTVHMRHEKSNLDGTGTLDLSMLHGTDILALDNSDSGCAGNDRCFFPETVRVSRGDTVTWVNTDTSNVLLEIGNVTKGTISRYERQQHTFETNGTYQYSDKLHPWATGRIIVGADAVMRDTAGPAILSARISGPNNVRIVFTEPVNATLAGFAGITLGTEDAARQFTKISGSGSDTLIMSFDGEPAATDATGMMPVGGHVTDLAGNTFAGQPMVPVMDGQPPVLESARITSADAITVIFSEPVTAEAGDFDVIINGTGSDMPRGITNLAGSNSSRIILTVSGTDIQHGTAGTVKVTGTISDAAGNRVAGLDRHVITEGRTVIPAMSTVRGTIFSDANGNGIWDEHDGTGTTHTVMAADAITGRNYDIVVNPDGSMSGYRMLAFSLDTGRSSMAVSGTNGTYVFELGRSPGTTLVQTGYFPQDTVVFDPRTSWFGYMTPEPGNPITFDVGFGSVPQDMRVRLEIQTYIDENLNGTMDAGEPAAGGIGGIYVRTYTTGPVAYPVTGPDGRAVLDDLLPADFALFELGDVLARSGYAWVSLNYERTDSAPHGHDPRIPIAAGPAPGSTHTMWIGLAKLP